MKHAKLTLTTILLLAGMVTVGKAQSKNKTLQLEIRMLDTRNVIETNKALYYKTSLEKYRIRANKAIELHHRQSDTLRNYLITKKP